jgi:lysyl-tRNA synthetase class 2
MTLRDRLQQRARLLAEVRGFFTARDVVEVTTPVLSQAGNTDPNIDSFQTRYRGPQRGGPATRYLRTSPEFFHKRLLAAGSGDLFEIANVFRDGECGARHNPEFTLLEWYRIGFDHHRLMDEVEALVRVAAALFGRKIGAVERLSYRDCYLRHAGVDPLTAADAELGFALADHGVELGGLGRDDLLDLIRTHRIEPQLAADDLLFLYDFPASQAALARINHDDPRVAERFELYLGRFEVANGYHELGNAGEQRRRFEHDLVVRETRGSELPQVDEYLLAALPQMPDCAGVALGIERLHLWLLGAQSIDEVIAFPFAVS